MSEIKLEVGQVWKSKHEMYVDSRSNLSHTTNRILSLFKKGTEPRVAFLREDGDGDGEFASDCHPTSIRSGYTLITNADGTPYVNELKKKSEKRMSEIKLEVGQVWEGFDNMKWTILGFSKEFNKSMVLHRLSDGRENNNTRFDCGYCIEEMFRDDLTLITNADGTPYVKPNDYQDGDVWIYKDKTPIIISVTDETVLFIDKFHFQFQSIKDTTFLDNPQDYKLIYRKGQGVINDA